MLCMSRFHIFLCLVLMFFNEKLFTISIEEAVNKLISLLLIFSSINVELKHMII